MQAWNIALGFYQNHQTAQSVLRKLRRKGYTTLSIQHCHDHRICIDQTNWIMLPIAIIIALLLVGFFFLLPQWNFILVPLVILLIIGCSIRLYHLSFLKTQLIRTYQSCVLKGETLVVVLLKDKEVRKVLTLLRHVESDHPISFLLKPDRHYKDKGPPCELKEPLTTEQLQLHAQELAKEYSRVSFEGNRGNLLLRRLNKSAQVLDDVRHSVAEADFVEQTLTISAEWLLDNTHIIQENIKEVRHRLPLKYYQQLPKMTSGPWVSLPRIYAIAAEIVDCTAYRLNPDNITAFLKSYLAQESLTIGELWALPLVLRLRLLECLESLAIHLDRRLREGELARFWGNRLLNIAKMEPDRLNVSFDELKKSIPHPSFCFSEELVEHLFDEDLVLALVKDWIEAVFQKPMNEIMQKEQMQEATDEVAFSSGVISLGALSQLSWKDIFESISPVDAILKNDPADIYANMDFTTRDRYRHVIEVLARLSKQSEAFIAESVVKIANQGNEIMTRHVGYYLIDDGLPQLEKSLSIYPKLKQKMRRLLHDHSNLFYLGSIIVLTACIEYYLFYLSRLWGAPTWQTIFFMILAFFPASECAIQLLNLFLPYILPPHILPKMSYEKRIPDGCKSIVVIPSMLSSEKAIQELLHQLETHFLTNQDPLIKFGLLLDYTDAKTQTTPEDADLFNLAMNGMQALQDKYGKGLFFLFLRERVYSEGEGAWLGWERKRGKLECLNRLLTDSSYPREMLRFGEASDLDNIRFVITLDEDTLLPKDKARLLIETLSHPLNAPQLSPDHTIQRGYTIIQPRVSTALSQGRQTWFARIFSDVIGLDPYTQAISDIYQDLMREGTYHGKCIYDVQAFSKILSGRFPEEQLLSHDLLEGAYVGVGYASDIALFDQFPQDYLSWSKRQHRWMRGDWQNIDWLFRYVYDSSHHKQLNPLSAINRWKIFDNLRRALLLPALFFLLITAWLFSSHPGIWTLLTAIIIFMPSIILFIESLAYWHSVGLTIREFVNALIKGGITVSLIPHQAYLSLDAFFRVMYRRCISKQHLLEWATSKQGVAEPVHRNFILKLCIITVFSIGLLFILSYYHSQAWVWAFPFCALWAFSPLIVIFLDDKSLVQAAYQREIPTQDLFLLRKIARKTWRYFDDFIGPANHWLPPDNYQAALNIEVAQRTSPTNIGLYLLALISAYDLEYLTCDEVVDRLSNTFRSIKNLELYEGHLLNWYDILSLKPLYPRYVSTVDSGNFLASLWTLEQALHQLISQPIMPLTFLNGIDDLLALFGEEVNSRASQEIWFKLKHAFDHYPRNIPEAVTGIHKIYQLLKNYSPEKNSDQGYWVNVLERELHGWESCIQNYFSWVGLLESMPKGYQRLDQMRLALLNAAPSLQDLASGTFFAQFKESLTALREGSDSSKEWVNQIQEAFLQAQGNAAEKINQIHGLVDEGRKISQMTNMHFLYNQDRKLFSIGYHVEDCRQDNCFYDLLASEARIASLVSIAKGEIPLDHWWVLGRPYRIVNGKKVLVSWGGTMFEYLMPLLFTQLYPDSLLGDACENAVACQIEYGKRRGFPWGVSESAFSEIDAQGTYQYRSFGVPGLGFKRDLDKDLVVSPYSSALALIVNPLAAIKNLRNLSHGTQNLYGPYGYYESIDFAREYGPHGERGIIIYAYMAHHQGMSLIAVNNLLHANIMPKRLHADPRIRGVESLLYERIPVHPAYTQGYRREIPLSRLTPFSPVPIMGVMDTPHTSSPRINLLANHAYAIMITNSGAGYSRWQDYDITRWRADTTCDSWGSFCYIKDKQSDKFWSSTFQPTYSKGQKFSAHFKPDKAEFKRRDQLIETTTEIAVSPQDNAEVRLVTFANLSKSVRYLELTSYSELALAPHPVDRSHPCFNKFFIQTEAIPDLRGLIAFRRLKSPEEMQLFAAHLIACDQPAEEPFQFETDRSLFIGRGHTLAAPQALSSSLQNSAGYVLDPIFSLRRTIAIKPGQRVQVSFITAVAETREAVIELMKKYAEIEASRRVFDLAWTFAQLELRHLRIHQEEAQLFQKLAGYVLYPQHHLRLSAERLRKNRLGQSTLWKYGISGDLPIVAVTVANIHELDIVKQILAAHAFWNLRGLKVDLILLNEEATSYDHPLNERLNRLIHSQSHGVEIGKPGGIYLINCDQIPEEDLLLILSVARANLIAARGFLRQHLVSYIEETPYPSRLVVNKKMDESPSRPLPFIDLPYFNGYGGFTQDGKEYAIYLGENRCTPAPWVNVIANAQFGTIVTESGLGASWYGNSQSYRITPWSNDPLLNPISDLIYIRDDQLGKFWTPTPAPIREQDAFRIRHGQGYTCFEHNSHGIEQQLIVFVPVSDAETLPFRIQLLQLFNASSRKRSLSLFSYSDLVLGGDKEESQMHVMTEWDLESQSIFAYNFYHPDFGKRIAFSSCSRIPTSFTGNRREFLGRNHPLSNPAALKRKALSGSTGTAIDPCAALHVSIELEPGEHAEVAFILGSAENADEARKFALLCRDLSWIDQTLTATKQWWDQRLQTVQVDCPELFVNFALNRWLLYQVLSCRIWGRSAFYQSSGAYGFRDQLQDVLAMLYGDPAVAREQILRAASRQFEEGDVQHWWLPPSNQGVRTRISDDLLWLPFATAQYVRVTKDLTILDENIPFIKGELLKEDQADAFFIPDISTEIGTLLEHCRRALKKGSSTGMHGLPLMGGGDWNDGMNLVGIKGKGESVWLAWFLIHVMNDFAFLLTEIGQPEAAKGYLEEAKKLAEAIEAKAWDGNWYRRAYYDDETPLGSKSNDECSIDSLAQSWAVISNAGRRERQLIALQPVEELLINNLEKMILLLTPPFDKSDHNPGYIKGYPPGIRENGGQYTHGSLWVALAFARINQGDRAAELLMMLHPVMHTQNEAAVEKYKIEPYVLAGDVYALEGKVGRGGWSWYTGSPAWMYRIWLEDIFGFKLQGNVLRLDPRLPKKWKSASITYRYQNTLYHISLENGAENGNMRLELDGLAIENGEVPLINDGKPHQVRLLL